MGVWDWIKRNSPDVTPISHACRKSYDVGRAATVQVGATAVQVDSAVRSKARVLHDYFSDDQVRSNLTRIAKNVSFHGALYFVRSYGGGPIIDVVSRSVQDNKVDSKKERIAALETRLAKLEKELASSKVVEHAEIPEASISITSKPQDNPDFSANMNVNQKLEDVLHIFMMKQFVGTKLLDDLIIPGARRRKEKPISSSDGLHECQTS